MLQFGHVVIWLDADAAKRRKAKLGNSLVSVLCHAKRPWYNPYSIVEGTARRVLS